MARLISGITSAIVLLGFCLGLSIQDAVTYSRVGCYEGVTLGDLIYSNCPPHWNDYGAYLTRFAEECNGKAKAAGLIYFGIHHYCKCSAIRGFDPGSALVASSCISVNKCHPNDVVCSGEAKSVFVLQTDLQASATSMPTATTTSQEVDPIEGICIKKLDIGIAMDTSSSFDHLLWDYTKNLVKALISSMLIGQSNIKLSIMTFSTLAKLEIKFNDYENIEVLEGMIEKLSLTRGFTRTDLALKLAKSDMFTLDNGMRADATKIFILLTDGKTLGMDATISWNETIIDPAVDLKHTGVEIFTVALGRHVSYSGLKMIASSPFLDHLLNVSDFSFPNTTAKHLGGMVCGEKFGNMALGKTTTQSSTYSYTFGTSFHAVDGSKNSDFGGLSCTETNEERQPWWQVDLGEEMEIFEVKIYNRGDCCGWRLNGFEIRVGSSLKNNGNSNAVCRKHLFIGTGEGKTFVCRTPLLGRYININIPGYDRILTLCEVEVVGRRKKSALQHDRI